MSMSHFMKIHNKKWPLQERNSCTWKFLNGDSRFANCLRKAADSNWTTAFVDTDRGSSSNSRSAKFCSWSLFFIGKATHVPPPCWATCEETSQTLRELTLLPLFIVQYLEGQLLLNYLMISSIVKRFFGYFRSLIPRISNNIKPLKLVYLEIYLTHILQNYNYNVEFVRLQPCKSFKRIKIWDIISSFCSDFHSFYDRCIIGKRRNGNRLISFEDFRALRCTNLWGYWPVFCAAYTFVSKSLNTINRSF